MALENILRRAFTLDQLIRQKNTGTVDEIAIKLQVSRRQVFNYLKVIRKIGKSCRFDPELQSYVYLEDQNQED